MVYYRIVIRLERIDAKADGDEVTPASDPHTLYESTDRTEAYGIFSKLITFIQAWRKAR